MDLSLAEKTELSVNTARNISTKKHIWTSVYHPQTMGKLSAFQLRLIIAMLMFGRLNKDHNHL